MVVAVVVVVVAAEILAGRSASLAGQHFEFYYYCALLGAHRFGAP